LLERGAEGEPIASGAADGIAPDSPTADAEAPAGEVAANSPADNDSRDEPLEDASRDEAAPVRSRLADLPAGYSEWAGAASGSRDGGEYDLEAFVSAERTLAEWLRQQVTLAITDPTQRMIGHYLVGLVDESGYLTGDLAAAAERLGTGIAEIEAVLAILQTFDPPGICARDLAECLALQLKERNRYDPAMAALVGRLGLVARREFPGPPAPTARLDLVARRDFAGLKKICGVGDEDLADMIAEIRRLNPKPGLAFGSAIVQPIVPDVFVRSAPDGAWLVELNSDTLPKVLLNQIYYAKVSGGARRDTEKSYLAECLQNATWLVRALDQRARTILKVANEIVRQQNAFFAHGVQHLRPLNLKTVAEAIGMHE